MYLISITNYYLETVGVAKVKARDANNECAFSHVRPSVRPNTDAQEYILHAIFGFYNTGTYHFDSSPLEHITDVCLLLFCIIGSIYWCHLYLPIFRAEYVKHIYL